MAITAYGEKQPIFYSNSQFLANFYISVTGVGSFVIHTSKFNNFTECRSKYRETPILAPFIFGKKEASDQQNFGIYGKFRNFDGSFAGELELDATYLEVAGPQLQFYFNKYVLSCFIFIRISHSYCSILLPAHKGVTK